MIFDTHCHPYMNKEKDTNQTINNFFENGWEKMNIIWTDIETSKKAVKLSKENKWVYASIWIHPCDVYELDLVNTFKELEKIYLENKENIIAIWECWLDYYWLEKDEKINKLNTELREKAINSKKKLQEIFFKAHINLAKEYNLPIIIHNRDSKDDALKILKETNFKNFIFHCYSENLEYAQKLIEFAPECKISFSGIVTFKNAKDIQETAKNIDIKHILAETDSPFLTPSPYRWKEENEPIYTKYVIEKVAELRWDKKEEVAEKIYKNSVSIFWLD